MSNPFQLTEEEREMMKDSWKKKKKKTKFKERKVHDKNNFRKSTVSSRNKKKISDDLLEFL